MSSFSHADLQFAISETGVSLTLADMVQRVQRKANRNKSTVLQFHKSKSETEKQKKRKMVRTAAGLLRAAALLLLAASGAATERTLDSSASLRATVPVTPIPRASLGVAGLAYSDALEAISACEEAKACTGGNLVTGEGGNNGFSRCTDAPCATSRPCAANSKSGPSATCDTCWRCDINVS